MAERHIVAMGGGGFSMEPRNPRLDDFVLSLARRKRQPRVCFVGTASGDSDWYIRRFHEAFPPSRAAATHLSTDTDFATPPAFSISAAVLLAVSARMSATITFAPSRANRIALARPIPEPAPVINATLSLSNILSHLTRLIIAG